MPTKTAFSTKCEILGNLWMWYKDTDHENWKEFFTWADLGLPLAYTVWQNLATAKTEGKSIVEETWNVFCELIDIDPNGQYTDLASAMDASPNVVVS